MKKLSAFLCIICTLTLSGQDWISFTDSETAEPLYEILQSSDTIVQFKVIIPGMYSTELIHFRG